MARFRVVKNGNGHDLLATGPSQSQWLIRIDENGNVTTKDGMDTKSLLRYIYGNEPDHLDENFLIALNRVFSSFNSIKTLED